MTIQVKYIIDTDGKLIINPSYREAYSSTSRGQAAFPCTLDDLVASKVRIPRALANIIAFIQSAEYAQAFFPRGAQVDESTLQTFTQQVLNHFSQSFVTNQIPVGLLGHLLVMQHYKLHFIIDDSSSMGDPSDLPLSQIYMEKFRKRFGQATRWQDAEDRLHRMIDLIAYIPTGPIKLSFLNHKEVYVLNRQGKTPEDFAAEAHQTISTIFSTFYPNGRTPLKEKLESAILSTMAEDDQAAQSDIEPEYAGTAFYSIGDGEPNNKATAIPAIQSLLLSGQRAETAQKYPMTFVDCTNKPKHTEWTEKVEEAAESGDRMLFVAAVGDYSDESKRVQNLQGPELLYSKGLWLVTCLVGALDPNGLDALNQPEPITKSVFDCMLGRIHSEQEYRRYFDRHPFARKYFNDDYQLFLNAQNEGEIPSVVAFRSKLSAALKRLVRESAREESDSDDDNQDAEFQKEVLVIHNIGHQINGMRSRGQFTEGNKALNTVIRQRMTDAQEVIARSIQQQFERTQLAASAPPATADDTTPLKQAAVYGTVTMQATPADLFSYPSKPVAGVIPQAPWVMAARTAQFGQPASAYLYQQGGVFNSYGAATDYPTTAATVGGYNYTGYQTAPDTNYYPPREENNCCTLL